MLKNLDQFSSKKILITGHNGFKGTWLSRILILAGAKVYGLALAPEPNSLYTRIKALGMTDSKVIDIRNRTEVNEYFSNYKFDGIFHLAAQPLVIRSYKEPIETFEVNVMGAANVLDAVLRHKSSKWVVVVTTDKVYKNIEKLDGYREDDSLGGRDPYSASKAATEMVVSAWQNLSEISEVGISIVSVRAGNVIGGGDMAENRLIPDLIRGFKSNSKTTIRYPRAIRPWQHVLDPLHGYLKVASKLMQGERSYKTFNFGPNTDSKLSVQQMAEYACDQWPGSAGIEIDSKSDLLPETSLLWLSSEKAYKELGWNNRIDAKEAIRWTIDWERESSMSSPLDALDIQIKEFFGSNK
jgi:CDP-glucose 4,6-dehydratase